MQVPYEVFLDTLIALGIAFLVAAVGYITGRLTRRAVIYLLTKVGFDEWFKKFAIGKAILRSGYSSSEFFGLVFSWVIYLAFMFMGIALAGSHLDIPWLVEMAYSITFTYISGFIKAFMIIVMGFILTDSFIGYIYKSSELRSEARLLVPMAEYLRVIIYLAVVLFALEQGGISVHTLNILITPLIWGLTIAMIVIMIAQVLQQVIRR